MPEYIVRVQHTLSAFRVGIPKDLVDKLGWKDCRYVTVRDNALGAIIIRRLPGEEKRNNEGAKRPVDVN